MAFFAVLPWSTLNIVSWTSGSMLLALGLTVPQAIGASVSSHPSYLSILLQLSIG